MAPSFRLIATDLDGTLRTPEGEITDRSRRVLARLHEQGLPIVLVTGLNPWVVRRIIDQIGPWVQAICLSGTFLVENGRPLPGQFVDHRVAEKAISLIVKHGYVPLVYGADHVTRYLPLDTDEVQEVSYLIQERPFQPYVPVTTVEALFESRPAQVSVCDTGERLAALEPILTEGLGDGAYIVHQPGDRHWLEVQHPKARKDTGLKEFADGLGISPEGVLYFGDSANDLPVFETFPFTVAMANARPEIKGLAWQITDSNAEDGVARFLAQWFEVPLD
ncbi:MAG: HAD-IIB family hydrolase [Anaerolineae bacterium]